MRFILELLTGLSVAAIDTAAVMANSGGCSLQQRSYSHLGDGGHADEHLSREHHPSRQMRAFCRGSQFARKMSCSAHSAGTVTPPARKSPASTLRDECSRTKPPATSTSSPRR